jgi:serine/threonine protein kinase
LLSNPKTHLGELPAQLGRYQILHVIGEGGMGVVVEALHIPLQRRVALKMLRPAIAKDKQFLDRFYREIRALGKVLDNQHVILATDGGEEDGIPFLTMEYIEGLDLDRLLQANGGTLPVGQACEMIYQAAIGLESIHQHGLIHRDLKPTNLMRTHQGAVKILDLGLARLVQGDDEQSELTPTFGILGTLDYQAPEQAQDPHGADIRADIYSLGCTLYKLLSGDVPFKDFSRLDKIRAHAREPMPELPANIPEGVRAIVGKMMAKDRAARYQTPKEVAVALAPFADRDPGLTITYQKNDLVAAPTPFGGKTPVNSVDETLSAIHDVTPTIFPAKETEARPPRRTARWAIGVSLLLTCLAGAALAFIRIPDESKRPVSLDRINVRETRFLLEREPQKIIWNTQNGNAEYRYEPRKLSVLCAANESSLFLLGDVTVPSYDLQIRIFQPEWTEGVGIVLGYRKVPEPYPLFMNSKNMVVAKLQLLHVRRTKNRDNAFELNIVRSTALHYVEPNGKEGIQRSEQARNIIRNLRNEKMLTIMVENRRLSNVFLDGMAPLDGLVGAEQDKIFPPELHQGGIGVWVKGTHAVFSDAAFRVLRN